MTAHLFDLGLTALWPTMCCMPLRREWIDALWRAHYSLGNWQLIHAEEEQQP